MSQRLRYRPKAGVWHRGRAADWNVSRRSTFSSNASQFRGEVLVSSSIWLFDSGYLPVGVDVGKAQKSFYRLGVKLDAGPFDQVLLGIFERQGGPIRAVRRQ